MMMVLNVLINFVQWLLLSIFVILCIGCFYGVEESGGVVCR